MAAIRPKIGNPGVNQRPSEFTLVDWQGLKDDDTGEPVEFVAYGDRSVHVTGAFGSANTQVILEGSNDGVNWSPLRNVFAQQLVFGSTSGALQTVADVSWKVRPRVINGTGSNLSVSLLLRL